MECPNLSESKICTKCKISKSPADFYLNNKNTGYFRPDCKECRKKYRDKNKERKKIYDITYRKINKKRRRDQTRVYEYARKRKDYGFRILCSLRTRLRNVLKGETKARHTSELVGCSAKFLKQHLEKQFYPDPKTGELMTWDNYGMYGWHVDHIRPCSSFNLENPRRASKMFSLH